MTKVTIIIPTFNRPSYLKRVLDYYSGYSVDYNIIVADSSSDENKILNKEIISSFQNLNILYLSHYSDKINPNYKLADALNYVQTEYCVLCADDDFITPEGIKQSVEFLENNPDFVAVHGHYISFYLKTNKKREKQFCWRPIYHQESVISQNPAVRLKFYLTNYLSPIFYGVYRTDSLKMIFGEFLKSKVEHYRFSELLLAMLAIIYGKIKCLDVFYSAREVPFLSLSIAGRINAKRDYIRDYQGFTKNTIEYIKFRDCLATHLNKVSLIDIAEAKKIIEEEMDVFLKKNFFNISGKIKKLFINYLRVPIWLGEKIRLICRTLSFSKEINIFPGHLDKSSKDYDDFNKIYNCVMSHTKI